MSKKKSNSGCLLSIFILGYLLMILLEPPAMWIVFGTLIIIAYLVYLIIKNKISTPSKKTPVSPPSQLNNQNNKAFSITFSIQGPGFVPGKVTNQNGDDFWKTPNSSGNRYGGWVYSGKGLAAVSGGGIEPALINPDLPISRITEEECHTRYLGYWPSYTGASPQARAAYFSWLDTGRRDPNADIGYVFLYYYGLERRVLHDAITSETAKNELPVIIDEIERLLTIYNKSGSFQNYAGSLLDFLKNKSIKPQQYKNLPSPLRFERDLKFEHRIALCQCAADGNPLPAEWAYIWFRSDPTTYLKTAARRCPEEFRNLFFSQYREEYGDGIILPQNKTLLKHEHHPASPSFGYRSQDYELKTDLPNVTVLTSPVKKLQKLADSCNEKLDSYSRFIKKNKNQSNTFDAIIELPFTLWPPAMRKSVLDASNMVESSGKPYIIPFNSFQAWFPGFQTISKQKMLSLIRCFGEVGLGMEPDPRFSGRIPTESSSIVLFEDDKTTKMSSPTPNYSAALLTLQLAATVAAADGQTTDIEKNMLTQQMENWLHLNGSEQRRLHARLCLFFTEPVNLSGLKSRIDDLDKVQREAIGDFLAMVALADSEISPSEITTLDKIFKLLGLDPKSVYSKLHIAASAPVTVKPAILIPDGNAIPRPLEQGKSPVIRLDKERITELLSDTKRISAILSSIFSQEAFEVESAVIPLENEPEEPQVSTLMGLETEQSALLRILLRQMRWTRSELEELASDRGLMLDGTLEYLNDAAFEKFNKPLFEGTDPIEINQELAHEVLQ